jgi:membrane protein
VGELVQRLSEQTATLIRQEMKLAQAELQEKGKRAGIGAGLFGAAGIVALGGFGALVAAVILALGEAVAMWISAFIVGGALLALAGVMALVGKRQVAAAIPPKPEAAMESVKADVAEIKEAAHR